jgi:hypothetical protein
LVCLCAPGALAGDKQKDKKSAELKWARGVASDFFEAAFKANLVMAENLIDSSLKKNFEKRGKTELKEWLNNSIAIQNFREPAIATEAIAPDRDEAVFTGTFRAKDRPKKVLTFTLRVVKEKDSGKWRVSYFRFQEKDEKSR